MVASSLLQPQHRESPSAPSAETRSRNLKMPSCFIKPAFQLTRANANDNEIEYHSLPEAGARPQWKTNSLVELSPWPPPGAPAGALDPSRIFAQERLDPGSPRDRHEHGDPI